MRPRQLKRKRVNDIEESSQYYDCAKKQNEEHDVRRNEMIYSVGTEIYFTSNVSRESIEYVIKLTTNVIQKHSDDFYDNDNKLTVTYVVDSPGGDLDAILKFVDFLDRMRKKYEFIEFVSVGTGMIASAGTIMCIVADRRYITKHCKAMVHELATRLSGKYTEIKSAAKLMESSHQDIISIYKEKTGLKVKVLEEIMMRETWFTATEYLELGFVDEIK
jgi:ATP-dependent protease ClpP protease subunit